MAGVTVGALFGLMQSHTPADADRRALDQRLAGVSRRLRELRMRFSSLGHIMMSIQ